MLRFLSKACGVLGYVVQYGCITHCTFEYIGDFVVCVGPSMQPTLQTDDIILTDRISPRLNKINRGDIVIAINPSNPAQNVCKRIKGLPGDCIQTNASFNLNPLSNTYTLNTSIISDEVAEQDIISRGGSYDDLHEIKPGTEKLILVPRGHVWVEGDNETNSSDSRNYGPIPIGLIRSKAICRLWPLTSFKILKGNNYAETL